MNHAFVQQGSATPAAATPTTQTTETAQTSQGAGDGRATDFVAVEGEHYSGGALLVEAYAIIWLVMMIWIFMLWRKATKLTERLDGLERTIDRAALALESPAAKKAAKEKA